MAVGFSVAQMRKPLLIMKLILQKQSFQIDPSVFWNMALLGTLIAISLLANLQTYSTSYSASNIHQKFRGKLYSVLEHFVIALFDCAKNYRRITTSWVVYV